MKKTILLTGATDGIGFETAKKLLGEGHQVLLYGRSAEKLEQAAESLKSLNNGEAPQTYQADLSDLDAVSALADEVSASHDSLDVLINNAGVLKASQTRLDNGMDLRFVVNTIAPYLLTQKLLPLLGKGSRVVNLSSAAQAPVDLDALHGKVELDDMPAYSQSKLGITMWTRHLAATLGDDAPMFVAINPGSLLASKMVKEGFGVEGSDLDIGADILARAALFDEFADASGKYYDNDNKRFADPHEAGMDAYKNAKLVRAIDEIIAS